MIPPIRYIRSHKRGKKLVKPGLQLGMIGALGGVAIFAVVFQLLLLGFQLTKVASKIEAVEGELTAQIPRLLLMVLGGTLAVVVPLIFVFGVFLTFRFAGPLHRYEQYLRAIASGKEDGLCRIRDGDSLRPLCDAINAAVTKLRADRIADGAGYADSGRRAA